MLQKLHIFVQIYRKVLEVGVLVWSLATAVVPVVAGFMPALLLSRVLVIFFFTYCLCVSVTPTKKPEENL